MKKTEKISVKIQKMLLSFQRDELTSSLIYKKISKKLKDKKNALILSKFSVEEAEHAKVWQQYTGKKVCPNMFKVFFYCLMNRIFGYTFVIKLLEGDEYKGIDSLSPLKKKFPEVERIVAQEKAHEEKLISILDEDRLNYIGAMVLGLNDALVELTGTIAGLTFVLMNTTLIAMAGIITGIAATLSMAASNYLAERANGNRQAFKACLYTGIAYLITVICLTAPYLLFPNQMFLWALLSMIVIVILLIFIFNFYISVVRSEKLLPKFLEMSGISLSVALISFLIGLLAKFAFGIDV